MKLSKIKTAAFCCIAMIAACLLALSGTLLKNNAVFADAETENGITVEADEIKKVVNMTDNSYRLKDGEYTVTGGKLVISESYLKTLEADTEYTFRAVTEDKDYDFSVKTDFTASTITPTKEDYTKGESVSFTVSGGVEVFKTEIDGVEYEFSVDGNEVTVSAEALKNLTGGTHVLKAFTASGRPTAEFEFKGLPDFKEDEVTSVSHVFFWVDIAVFAALIAGYATFTIVKKCRKK